MSRRPRPKQGYHRRQVAAVRPRASVPGYDGPIQRILLKLAEAQSRRIDTFGSDIHHFQLKPPLDQAAAAAFERAHGIALPPSYRAFVTQAGASGAGPFYGILPLSEATDHLDGTQPPAALARPCLLEPATPRSHDAANQPFQGTMAIVDQGCTFYAVLVVTGPHVGRVAYINVDSGPVFFVENGDFLSWYERWLDEILAGHQHHWFGIDMPGDEATLAAIAGDPGSPRRGDALGAMWRLPTLTPSTEAILRKGLDDESAAIRVAALRLLGKFAVSGVRQGVVRALSEDDPRVREAALRAVIASNQPWLEHARRMLADPEADVARLALQELDRAKALSARDLLRLIDSKWLATRSLELLATKRSGRALAALVERSRRGIPPDPLAAIIGLLSNRAGTPTVRRQALEVLLARFDEDPATPALLSGLAALVPDEPRALAALLAATRNRKGFVRYDAAYWLGERAGPQALAALEALASDTTFPRTRDRGTAWSVGENARRASLKIRARQPLS